MNEIALPVVLHHPSLGLTGSELGHDGAGTGSSPLRVMAEEQLCCRGLYMLLLTCAALEVAEQLKYGEYKTTSITEALRWYLQHSIQQIGPSTGADKTSVRSDDEESVRGASEACGDGFTRGWLCDARAQEMTKMLLQLSAYPTIAVSCTDSVNSWFAQNQHALAVQDMPTFCAGDMRGPLVLAIFDMMENMQPAIMTCVLSGIKLCAEASRVSAEASRHVQNASNTAASSSLRASGSGGEVGDSHGGSGHRETTAAFGIPAQFVELHVLLQAFFCDVSSSELTLSPRVLEVIVHSFPAMVALPAQSAVQPFLRALVPLCNRSSQVFAVLHGYLQKRIQSTDYDAQMSAVRLLVPLLFSVPVSAQMEVARTVTFVFSRPAVFCREISILLVTHLQQVLSQAPDGETDAEVGEMHLSERVVVHLRTAVDRYLSAAFSASDGAALSSGSSAGGLRGPRRVCELNNFRTSIRRGGTRR
jgi:hypothetical protein